MNKEIWKDIVGYEGKYQVSSFGRVKSLVFINRHLVIKREKIMNLTPQKTGYLLVRLSNKGFVESLLVHRIVAKTFLNNKFNKAQVDHINAIRSDNRVGNLQWSTHSENQQYRKRNGTDGEGVKNWRSTLTEDLVRRIRADKRVDRIISEELLKSGIKCSRSVVNHIKNYKTYRNVT